MCCTIRPRSQSDRREATVRSRLLHLLPPSNPRPRRGGQHAPRGHVLLLTHKRSRRSRERRYQRYVCTVTRVSTPIRVPCYVSVWIRCARASTRPDREHSRACVNEKCITGRRRALRQQKRKEMQVENAQSHWRAAATCTVDVA